ncbi:MAG: DUF4188 domain-containing protein [Cyanobacteria bacterium J06650_10]
MNNRNIFPGHYTADVSEPCVVFLIGMRVNRFWAIKKWWSVASAMGPMMATLSEHPEKGMLGSHSFFRAWPLETCMVSYWRSFEDLTRFARNEDDPHWAAWRAFMRNVGNDGSVGIWHETYRIDPGSCECIYGNMPAYGLAGATQHIPISGKTRSAAQRMAVSA